MQPSALPCRGHLNVANPTCGKLCWRLALFALVMAGILPVRATTSDAHDEAGMLTEALIDKGVALHGSKVGYLKYGDMEEIGLTLEKGHNFIVVVGGCRDAYNLDGVVFDPETRETIAGDTEDRKLVFIGFTPEESKKYTLAVRMTDATKDGAHYAVLLGETESAAGSEPKGAPSIDMETEVVNEDGQRETLRSIMGDSKYLYLRVWATWCPPCIALLPNLQARHDSFAADGIKVVAINNELGQGGQTGGDIERSSIELARRRVSVPSYAELSNGAIAQTLGVDSVPRSIILDREGKVIYNGHPVGDGLEAVAAEIGISNFELKAGLEPRPGAN